ncbi:hypothetical protein Tco_0109707 [Tanacetum coccineum]
MILGRSSNGSADEQEKKKLCKVTKSEELPYPYPAQSRIITLGLGLRISFHRCGLRSVNTNMNHAVYLASLYCVVLEEGILYHQNTKYKISEKDFKILHPKILRYVPSQYSRKSSTIWPKTDKTSFTRQSTFGYKNKRKPGDQKNHVVETFSSGIVSYQTKNTFERLIGSTDFYFKEDYPVCYPTKPRAVVYRDRNDQRKLMRLNELHKFSDGTLTRVMEKLDQMVKDFHLYEYNKGMETRKWSEDDKRRSKDFITAIEKE